MIRAGVFIGVNQTGGLQTLRDAAGAARRMHRWALEQGLVNRTEAKLIVDSTTRGIDPGAIKRAIREIVEGAGADQLIVYFAGHGVNINRQEHWLLTDAPGDPNAAVNVSGSVDLAQYCGIQHVVFISDACRVAPDGIQAQNVQGVDIFPNTGGSDEAKPVDRFFACSLGRTAAEIKDPTVAASSFTALYTDAMLDGLKGTETDLLVPSREPGDSYSYVMPRKLGEYLKLEVRRRVAAMGLQQKVNQNPDTIIQSDALWISRVGAATSASRGRRRLRQRGGSDVSFELPVTQPPEDLESVTQQLIQTAVNGDQQSFRAELQNLSGTSLENAGQIAATVQQLAQPFGPDHFETQCGIKIRGQRIIEFFAPRAHGELLGTGGDLLRIDQVDGPPASVLLRFEGGSGAIIPAIPEFLAALTFEDGELVDVAYEPSANDWRWHEYQSRATELRALRAAAAMSSQHGRFRLDQVDAAEIARKMQYAKMVDPGLAIYAAYAYHEMQAVGRIREMEGYLRDELRTSFFDLALLSRSLIGKSITREDRIAPFVPLLSQGWGLIAAHRIQLPSALQGIEGTLQESLWSLYSADGVDMLRRAMGTGEVL